MKNIHLLPTDKPSRLWMTKLGNLTRCHDIKPIKEALGNNVNIYITSDEKIKEGDLKNGEYYLYFNKVRQFKEIDNLNRAWKDYKKIILSTDQDLIKDGVQAIDDEFLEWFVKNPSCESVEVDNRPKVSSSEKGFLIDNPNYNKIIIPKEENSIEAKQRAKNYMSLKGVLEPKQIKCYCGHTTYCDCSPLEEPKQETTLQEAAKEFVLSHDFSKLTNPNHLANRCFQFGAKWQQERMYSEEDMKEAFNNGRDMLSWSDVGVEMKYNTFNDWFEQFKYKKLKGVI